ncbi:MAG TPA: type II toxin-antitoxin system prevent-host-death family antitoxin [Acidobacteriaceae bacterium]
MLTVTEAEAQDRLGELIAEAQREPVSITQAGQPSAFLISVSEMEDLRDQRRRQEAVAAFEAWTILAREHRTAAADELTDEDIVRLVHELR